MWKWKLGSDQNRPSLAAPDIHECELVIVDFQTGERAGECRGRNAVIRSGVQARQSSSVQVGAGGVSAGIRAVL